MTAPAGTTAAGLAAVLDEIRQRVEAATPLPWTLEWDNEEGDGGGPDPLSRYPLAIRTSRPHVQRMPGVPHPDHDFSHSEICELSDADAVFAAAARRDVPRLLAAIDAAIKPHTPIQIYRSADDCGHECPPEPDWKTAPDQAAIDAWDAWHEEHTAGNGPGSSDITPRICMLSPGRMACPACSALIYETWGDDDRFVDASECVVWPAFAAALSGEETAS